MKQCKSCKKASVNQRRAEAKKPMCARCKQRKRLDGYDNMESGRRKATCRACLAAKLKLYERGPRKAEPIPIAEQFGNKPEHLMLLRKPLL